MADDNKNIKQQAELYQRLVDLQESFGITQKEIASVEKGIATQRIKSAQALDDEVEKLLAQIEANKSINAYEERRKKLKNEIKDVASELNDIAHDLLDAEGNLFDLSSDQIDNQKKLVQSKLEELNTIQKTVDGRTAEGKVISDMISQSMQLLDALENQERLIGTDKYKTMQGAFDEASDKAIELGGNVDKMFASLPGGAILSNALGLNNASEQLQSGVNAGFQAMNAHIAQGGTAMGGLKAAMKGFNAVVMMNPLLLVVAAGVALFGVLSKNEKAAQELADKTGQTFVESKRLVESMRTRNTLNDEMLATTEDILAVQTETISKFGAAGELSAEVASNVAETGMAFGYGAQEAGKVQTALMGLGASGEAAAKAQEKLAADAFKAGVNVSAVMKDISENSKTAQRYMGGNLEAITDAAIEAAKLGLNLGDLAGMADKLLNIEGSLTAQYEFQAMTGKQINVDKARQLALEGDLEGMAKEISKEAGTLAEFNEMNVFQKEKMAQAFGMEVDQMQDMLAMEDARNKHGKDMADQAAKLGISAAEMAEMSDEELKSAMAREQSSQNLAKTMSDIGDTLMSLILPVAEAFGQVLSYVFAGIRMALTPFRAVADFLGSAGVAGQIVLSAIKGLVIAGLAYLAVQKISAMLRNRAAAKDDERKKKAVERAEIEAKYNNLVNQGNDASTKAVNKKKKQIKQNKTRLDQEKAINKEKKKGNDLTQEQIKQAGASQKKGLLGRMKDKAGGMLGKAGGMLKAGYNKIGGVKGLMAGGALIGGGMAMFGGGGGGGGGEEVPPEQQTKWGMPSFDTGGTVATTGVAKVHAGEQITPASKVPGSEPKGDSGGGGGASIDYEKLGAAVAMALAQNPPVIHLDGKKMSNEMAGEQSYNRGVY